MHPERGEQYYAMAQIQYDTGHLDRAEQASRLALERDTSKIPSCTSRDPFSSLDDEQMP